MQTVVTRMDAQRQLRFYWVGPLPEAARANPALQAAWHRAQRQVTATAVVQQLRESQTQYLDKTGRYRQQP